MGIDRERLMNDVDRIFYGFVVVIAGLVAVSVGYLVAVFTKLPESDVATALASFGGVIGTIVGAFFGLHLGAAGKEKAEQRRQKAEEKALELAGMAPPDEYKAFRNSRPELFRD